MSARLSRRRFLQTTAAAGAALVGRNLLVAADAEKRPPASERLQAGSNYRRVVELVQSGAIGPVREVHVWCGKSWGGGDRPQGSEPVPPGLHWDTWLGPAPERPFYHGPDKRGNGVYHPFNWRRWW